MNDFMERAVKDSGKNTSSTDTSHALKPEEVLVARLVDKNVKEKIEEMLTRQEAENSILMRELGTSQ
jgi:hypothetical protein